MRGIAFCGFSGVGKSVATDVLVNECKLVRTHVKHILGECIAPILLRMGVDHSQIHDCIFGDRINDPLPGGDQLTTRILLQAMGGGFLQETSLSLMQRLAIDSFAPGTPLVVESVRYAHEAAYLRERNFKIVRITRPGFDGLVTSRGKHQSESGQDFPVDATIANDSSIENFASLVLHVASILNIETLGVNIDRPIMVIVNGRPRSGKDTLVDAIEHHLNARFGLRVKAFSTIDVVRKMLDLVGVDVTRKLPEDRALLANIGMMLENHSRVRTRSVIDAATSMKLDMFFVHVREPEVMAHLIELHDGPVFKLWVSRPGLAVEHASSRSDVVSADDVEYDFSATNDGDVYDLQCAASAIAEALVRGDRERHFSARDIGKGFPR